jgi:hypothetical protein
LALFVGPSSSWSLDKWSVLINTEHLINRCCPPPAEYLLPQAYIITYNRNFFTFTQIKVKESHNRPSVAQRVPGGLGSQISWRSAREGGEVVNFTHRPPLPPVMFLVLICTRGWVNPRAMVRSEGNISLKNPVTPPGIDPRTVQLVAQHLNHYATPGPTFT